MTKASALRAENYLEVVADIAFVAGNMTGRSQLHISDSRQLMNDIAIWAKQFEAAFDQEKHGGDYMELVDDYAVACLLENKFAITAFLTRMQNEPSIREKHQLRITNGFDQDTLDAAAESGFANGAFENTAEEMGEIAEESLMGQMGTHEAGENYAISNLTLKEKLNKNAASLPDQSVRPD